MATTVKTSVKIYVEGGSDSAKLDAELRQAFQHLFKGWGLDGCLPRVVACGSRRDAFNDFKTALKKAKPNEKIVLLVDSEEHPTVPLKWQHVVNRDSWEKPDNADESNIYFMAVCMESWLLADTAVLADFYGKGFDESKLPKVASHESIEILGKQNIYDGLKNATKGTQKGEYGKGSHSFKILNQLDAQKVIHHGKYAKELYCFLTKLCQVENKKLVENCDDKEGSNERPKSQNPTLKI